jgi:TonB family protein
MLATSFSGGQQASPSVPSPIPDAQPARVKVYTVGPDVTAPELLPLNVPPFPDEKCKKKQEEDGEVVLSFLVDTTGKPHNIMFLQPVGSDLDKFALLTLEADRFKPGTHEGAPVVVAESAEVDLKACVEEKKDDRGKRAYSLRLLSQPVQNFETVLGPQTEAVLTLGDPSSGDFGGMAPPIERVGQGVSAPALLKSVDPEFTDAARRARYEGNCLISIVVDAHGMPQNIQVVRRLDYGMSDQAVEAVSRYRFKPAMKEGVPVPVKINIEVQFHLVDY